MRVLVTGGAGFIGSHFAKRLQAAGDDVRVLDKLTYSGNPANLEGTGIELVVADICDAEAVAARPRRASTRSSTSPPRRTSTARSSGRPSSSRRTSRACRCCSTRRVAPGIRLVHVSTDEVYGDVAEGVSSVEDDPLRPSSPYSAAKAGGDLQVLGSVRTYGVDALITRGSNTYGPFQYPGEAAPALPDERARRRAAADVRRRQPGSRLALRRGPLRRDRSSRSQGRGAGEVYNIGGGEEATNREITELVLEHTGADASLVRRVEDRAGHDRRYSLDTTKARTALGWAPRTPLAEGFALTAAWYSDQPRLVGADQELGRLPRVLRAPVRGAPRRLLALAAPLSASFRSLLISFRLP